jgi:hypothetical protein
VYSCEQLVYNVIMGDVLQPRRESLPRLFVSCGATMEIFEQVRRCRYCQSDMTDSVSAQSYRENPYCALCVNDRLRAADEAMGPTKWVRIGHYIKLVPVNEIALEGT